MDTEKKTSPWVWVGIGCGVLVVFCLVIAGGIGIIGYRAVRKMGADLKDPVTRTANVKSVMGCRGELPAGYHAFASFSIPWVMDLAIISDKEPEFVKGGRPFDQRGFIYLKTLHRSDKKLSDYFEGRADPNEILGKSRIGVGKGKEIGRGTFQLGDMGVYYISRRGTIDFKGEELKGITSVLFFDCHEDKKFRLGLWLGPDPLAEDADLLKGTPADESAMREFLSHFSPCGDLGGVQ